MSGVLLVDMGNQRLKWAGLEVDSSQSLENVLSQLDTHGGVLDIAHDIADVDSARQFNALTHSVNKPDQVLFSCVSARQAGRSFEEWCRRTWDLTPKRIYSERSRFGLDNQYDDPGQLGSDRWLAAIAAYTLVAGAGNCGEDAVIVIDAGTAVTVDLVKQNMFMGGAILPGVSMAISALGNSTGEIRINDQSLTRGFSSKRDLNVVATNSDDAVIAGALASVAGGVEKCMELMRPVCGSRVEVLITGGDARLVASMMNSSVEVVPNLVLAGLALIAAEDAE